MTWAQMYGKEPVDSDTEEETDNGTYDEKEGADMADMAEPTPPWYAPPPTSVAPGRTFGSALQ